MDLSRSPTMGRQPLVPFGKPMRERHFLFDPKWIPINHGSFGTPSRPVLDVQRSLQADLEARPDWYIRYEFQRLLLESRKAVAEFHSAPLDEVVLVQNASTATTTILRSLKWENGDVILYSDVIYGALLKTVKYLEEISPAKGRRVDVVFPASDDAVIEAFEAAILDVKTQGLNPRMAIFDTICSMPGLRLPFEGLVSKCKEHGVLSLVDGAHGSGHVPLDLSALDADFFTSNLHKWLFVPRACAVLHVPERNQHLIRSSLPTSHGFRPADGATASIFPTFSTPFVELFEFVGTVDVQGYLTVPAALKFREEVCGGEEVIREYCQRIAREGGDYLAARLGTEVMGPPGSGMRDCCFTNVRLPIEIGEAEGMLRPGMVGVAYEFITHHSSEVNGVCLQTVLCSDGFWLRVSGMIYLELSDFEPAARAVEDVVEKVRSGEFEKGGFCARCVDAHPEILLKDTGKVSL